MEDSTNYSNYWVQIEACDAFSEESTRHYAHTIWEATRKQALLGKLSQNETLALQVVNKLVTKCSQNKDGAHEFVSIILRDCEPFMINLEMQLVEEASKILQSVANVSTSCCIEIVEKLVPLIMERAQYDATTNEDKQKSYQITYAPVLADWIKLAVRMNAGAPLLPFLDGLTVLCMNLVESCHDTVCLAGIQLASCILGLFTQDNSLLMKMKSIFVVVLNKIELLNGNANAKLTEACCNLIHEAARLHWTWFSQSIYPEFIEKINRNDFILKYVVWAVGNEESFALVQVAYLLALKEEKISIILECTKNLINSCKSIDSGHLLDYNRWENIITHMIKQSTGLSVGALLVHSSVLKIITFEFDVTSQIAFLDAVVNKQSTPLEPKTVLLLSESLNSFYPEASSRISDEYRTQLLSLSNETEGGAIAVSAHKVLCSLLNKCSSSDQLLLTLYHDINLSHEQCAVRIEQLGWLTRACLLNPKYMNSSHLKQFKINVQEEDENKLDVGPVLLKKSFELLREENDNGMLVGKVLYKVLDMDETGEDSVENTRWRASLLFTQRILITAIPIFIEQFNKAPQGVRSRFFKVFTCLLHLARDQSSFVAPEVSKLFPVLVLSLGDTCDDVIQCQSVLYAVEQVLSNANTAKAIQSHLDTVTMHLTRILTQAKNMNLKLGALDVLKSMVQPGVLPPFLISQQENLVQKALKKAVDDKKRLVRVKAAQISNMWALST